MTDTLRLYRSSSRQIENHPLVVSIETPHVWQLVPAPTSSTLSRSTESTTTVVTLTALVKPDVDEKGMLEVTQWIEERCRNAGNVSSGGGGSSREVTVEVKRAK